MSNNNTNPPWSSGDWIAQEWGSGENQFPGMIPVIMKKAPKFHSGPLMAEDFPEIEGWIKLGPYNQLWGCDMLLAQGKTPDKAIELCSLATFYNTIDEARKVGAWNYCWIYRKEALINNGELPPVNLSISSPAQVPKIFKSKGDRNFEKPCPLP